MPLPLVLVTGFGAFADDANNPSRVVAAELERDPPRGVRVRARELPVTFAGAPRDVASFVAEFEGESPALLLGLGVQREAYFRLETRARGRFDPRRADNVGETGASIDLGREFATIVDVAQLARMLRDAGAGDVRISDDAGGYVCERTFRALLEEGERIDAPAMFLHVPPARAVAAEEQARLVRAMLATLFNAPTGSAAVLRPS
jgi:pyroglutamyl-peptidase